MFTGPLKDLNSVPSAHDGQLTTIYSSSSMVTQHLYPKWAPELV